MGIPLRQNLKVGLIMGSVTAAMGIILTFFPVGDALVFLSYDLPFVFRPQTAIQDCVIVEMDEKSYQELNQEWGQKWDRALHARLVDKLTQDGAKLVVFDVWFAETTTDETDRKLAEAIRANGKVVLAATLESIGRPGVVGRQIKPPIALLATNAAGWGIAERLPERDGVVRRAYIGEEQYPSLDWRAAALLDAPKTRLGDARKQERWMNYYGPAGTPPSISYCDALTSAKGYFKDKAVFVGGRPRTRFVGDEVDEFRTPYTRWDGRCSSGVEIIATSFLNLLHGDWLVRCPWLVELLIVLVVGLASGFGFTKLKPLYACLGTLAGAGVIFVLAVLVVWTWHVWGGWAVIALAQLPLALVLSLAYQVSTARERAREVGGEIALPEATPGTSQLKITGTTPPGGTPLRFGSDLKLRDFAMLRSIGKGGYGEVWLCKDAVGRFRAAKFVYRDRFDDVQPYQREFGGLQKFARLNHPRLLRVFHVSIDDEAGYFYYVMELADDEHSGQEIKPDKYSPRTLVGDLRCRGRLSVEECVALGLSLADGLAHLHAHNLVHRDIKPSNIVYVDGMAKLADIGLVADVEKSDVSAVGTREFMDPVFAGSVLGDIYSFGKVLYVAATGFDPKQFPEFPPCDEATAEGRGLERLKQIVLKACAPSKADRYPSVAQMLADLEGVRRAVGGQV